MRRRKKRATQNYAAYKGGGQRIRLRVVTRGSERGADGHVSEVGDVQEVVLLLEEPVRRGTN